MTDRFASKSRAAASARRRPLFAIILPLPMALLMMFASVGAPYGADSAPEAPANSVKKHHHRRHEPTPAPTPNVLPEDISVPAYKPGAVPFRDGEKLTYQATWVGVPAASAVVEFHRNRKDPSADRAEVTVETSKLVDVFFKMRDYVRERFTADSITPQEMYIRQSENKRFDEYTVTFDRPKALVTAVKKNSRGSFTREFKGATQYGILSGTVMALSQALKPGDKLAFDVVTGSNRYVFEFHVDGRERIRVPVGDFDAIKITPTVVYMSDGNMRSEAREVEVWVSADKRHLPLRVQAAAFIGSVRADLVKIDGAGAPSDVSRR
jgi:Protein of unknown function (DUF3108)